MRPRLALLPGLLCDASVWKHQIDALEDIAEIHVPDFAPFASITDMALETLARVPGDFAVAGHSMGGRVALEIMRIAPRRVTRLGLLNTGYTPKSEGEWARRLELIDFARAHGMEAVVERWVAPLLCKTNSRYAAVLKTMREIAARSSVTTFENHNRALYERPDHTTLLPGIACPTVLATGVADPQSPLSRHETMAALIPGALVHAVANCGHLTLLEAPRSVNRILRDWLLAASRGAPTVNGTIEVMND